MNRLRGARPWALPLALACGVLAANNSTASGDEPDAPPARRAADAVAASVVQMRHVGSVGTKLGATSAPLSGVVIAPGGWVVTSDFGLAEDPAATVVRYSDGRRSPAKLIARDHHRGLALFRAADPPEGPAPLEEAVTVRPGETTVAVGRALRHDDVNLAVGVVSAVGRFGGVAVQTDAAVSPTNYGGLLVNLRGEAIGVLTPLAPKGQSGADWYDSGIGFAIPLEAIRQRLRELQGGRSINPGWLGCAFESDAPLREPALVSEVREGGPASTAGIAAGDTLVAIDERPTPTVSDFRRILSGYDAGESVKITLRRGGRRRDLTVALAEHPASDR